MIQIDRRSVNLFWHPIRTLEFYRYNSVRRELSVVPLRLFQRVVSLEIINY